MRLAVPFLLLLLAPSQPGLADPANVTVARSGPPGAAARLVLAQKTYQAALRNGDAVMLLAAIRLARIVTLREPTGWSKATTGDAVAETVTGRTAPADPASPQNISILQSLAGEDPSLQDLVFDLDAQLPHGRHTTAIRASSDLAAGQSDTWRIALSGDVAAELGLIGDGDSPLGLVVTDESGAIICAVPPDRLPALCRFTPATNGFFSVTVQNRGTVQNSYHLIGS